MNVKADDWRLICETISALHDNPGSDESEELYAKCMDAIAVTEENAEKQRKYKSNFAAEKRKADPTYAQGAKYKETYKRVHGALPGQKKRGRPRKTESTQ